MKLEIKQQELLEQLQLLNKEGRLVGLYHNVPNEVYHHPDCPGVSKSNLDQVDKSYRHYMQAMENARKEREEIDFRNNFFIGNAFHELVLEPLIFMSRFCIEPTMPKCDKRTTAGKNLFEEWTRTVLDPFDKENQGKIRMPSTLWDQLHDMRDAVMAHPQMKRLVEISAKEVTIFWVDEKTGLLCKCRPDMLALEYEMAIDLKSCVDASYIGFRKSVAKFNYDKQAAFYSAGVKAVTGKKVNFLFCAVEKTEPYGTQAFLMVDPAVEVGQQLYRRSLDKILRVHKGTESKNYSDEIVSLDLPAYAYDIESRN